MPTIHSSSRQFLLQLGVSNLPKSVDQTLILTRDENFFQLPITAPTNGSLDNDIVEEDGQGYVVYMCGCIVIYGFVI